MHENGGSSRPENTISLPIFKVSVSHHLAKIPLVGGASSTTLLRRKHCVHGSLSLHSDYTPVNVLFVSQEPCITIFDTRCQCVRDDFASIPFPAGGRSVLSGGPWCWTLSREVFCPYADLKVELQFFTVSVLVLSALTLALIQVQIYGRPGRILRAPHPAGRGRSLQAAAGKR